MEAPCAPVRAIRALALVALLAGLALIGLGVARGDVRVGLFLIIPFVYGTGIAPALGMLLLFAAAFLWMVGRVTAYAGPPPPEAGAPIERRSRSGGVVLLGPIPIVWGSDRRVLPWMVLAGVVLLGLAILLTFLLR